MNIDPVLVSHLKQIRQNLADHSWDEQAVPSYLHKVFAVRYVFWRRLFSSLECMPTGDSVLDYGCGAGAMIPLLVKGFKKVNAFDIDDRSTTKVQELVKKMELKNVNIVSMSEGKLKLQDNSIDAIFALDVLEHVDDLPVLLMEFRRILKPQGKIIVSSPTENWLYKFMRRFGGPGYQGEFHVRAAKEVESELANIFKVKLKKKIFPVFTFFRIVEAQKL